MFQQHFSTLDVPFDSSRMEGRLGKKQRGRHVDAPLDTVLAEILHVSKFNKVFRGIYVTVPGKTDHFVIISDFEILIPR